MRKKKFKRYPAMTLAEILLALAIIGVMYSITIPFITSDLSQKNNQKLFITAYKLTENIIDELINDTLVYQDGRFNNNTFCGNFMDAMNTVGIGNCTFSSLPDTTSNFSTTNGMRWYNLDSGFSSSTCSDVAELSGECIKIQVDVNSYKEPNSDDSSNPKRDILSIYMTEKGRLGLPVGLERTFINNH